MMCVDVTGGKTADNKGTYDIPLSKGSVIVADRGLAMLNIRDSSQVCFVVGHKDNIRPRTIKELEPPEERHQHVLKVRSLSL